MPTYSFDQDFVAPPPKATGTLSVPTEFGNDVPSFDQTLQGDGMPVTGRISDENMSILKECWDEMNMSLGIASRCTGIPPHQRSESGATATSNIWNTYANYFRGNREEEIRRAYGDDPPAGVSPSLID